ncbi:MAG: hypothetical protein WCC10_12835 [Tumebacillaceae bacterium]
MNQIKWRLLLQTAVVLGVIAGVVPMFFSIDLLLSTMPIAMMFSIYFLVPKVKEKRLPSGILVSVLTAVIGLVVYFIYQFLTLDPATVSKNLVGAVSNLLMSIVIISLFGSWFFVWVNNWTEKKRTELDAKVAARKQGNTNNKRTKSNGPKIGSGRPDNHPTKKKFKNYKKKK